MSDEHFTQLLVILCYVLTLLSTTFWSITILKEIKKIAKSLTSNQ